MRLETLYADVGESGVTDRDVIPARSLARAEASRGNLRPGVEFTF